MVKVRIENLVKRFGQTVAVDRVNLEVEDGRFTCLLGPSGCGKTTTLRMIAGLELQDEGSIFFDDRCVDDLSPGQRRVSMVFQFYAIYPNMKVFDEIAFPLKMMKRPQQEIRERVKKVAEMVDLSASLNERAARVSVDQKQRIELARAIIREPDIFLFDEPLTNLDANLRADMRAEIARIQKELRITTIYVTHDQFEAMALADKIAVMDSGKIIQYDTTSAVYEKPKNLFVAGFIGTPPMNFINCKVRKNNGNLCFDGGDLVIPVDQASQQAIQSYQDRNVIVGIRPEYITINGEVSEGGYAATADIVEPLGHRLVVNVKIGSTNLKVNAPFTSITTGQKIELGFPCGNLRVFEPGNGNLII